MSFIELNDDGRVVCVLCQRSEETKVTGPLSTKLDVTAHQNCLLYSSGLYCQNSPEFDDLFGFAVDDVEEEVKRGNRLRCAGCKGKCATVGCEVKRCKSSYHYPCAVEYGAESIEDEDKGQYVLYCNKHRKLEIKLEKIKTPTVICLVCNKTEEHISLDSLNDGIVKLYCPEHKPQSHEERPNGAGLDHGSDSSLKRNQRSNGRHDKVPSKVGFKRKISSDSDDMFAPIEWEDSEENSKAKINTPDTQTDRNDLENGCATTSGNECQSQDGCEDEMSAETDILMAESQSLLLPVTICMDSESTQMTGSTTGSSLGSLGYNYNLDPQTQSSSGPHASSTDPGDHPPHSRVDDDAPPNSLSSSSQPSPSFSVSLLSVPKSHIDSASFWKDFNEAGRTKAIFSDFIDELNDISDRIESNQASQEDYDMALRVMEASGSLAVLVAKQDEEIKKKKVEVQIEEAAMNRIMSAMGSKLVHELRRKKIEAQTEQKQT